MPQGVQGFQKGHEPMGRAKSRQSGERHQLTSDECRIGGQRSKRKTVSVEKIREFCIDAMVSLGSDGKGSGGALGYIQKFAKDEPKAFMTTIVARLIPQQIKADITHDFDVDGAVAAIEHSIDGILAARGAKEITADYVAERVGHVQQDVAILVEPSSETS